MTTPLPVIVGLGGINSAGRTSGFQGYKRLVYDSLSTADKQKVCTELKTLAAQQNPNAAQLTEAELLRETLVRPITHFDTSALPVWKTVPKGAAVTITLQRADLPSPLPQGWSIRSGTDPASNTVEVTLAPEGIKTLSTTQCPTSYGASLPHNFDPSLCYQSRQQPRTLTMTVYGGSDLVHDTGLDIEKVLEIVPADRVGIFCGSAIGQTDAKGMGGYMYSRLMGGHVSARSLALGLSDTPGGFLAAYTIGSAGHISHIAAACATSISTMNVAANMIRSGKIDFAITGGADAQLTPEYMESFAASGAMYTEERMDAFEQKMREVHGADFSLDRLTAARPFAESAGVAIGESAQFVAMMSDKLALECNARIQGCLLSSASNSDGVKDSISAPGIGNVLSFSTVMDEVRRIVGTRHLADESFCIGHGSGTKLNRETESAIFSRCAQTFGVPSLPVTGLKGELGHTMAAAAGDQLAAAIGAFENGIIPGIHTASEPSAGMTTANLEFLYQDKAEEPHRRSIAFVNSKGFNGNNVTVCLGSSELTRKMLATRHGITAENIKAKSEGAESLAKDYDEAAHKGDLKLRYLYGSGALKDEEVALSEQGLSFEQNGAKCKVVFGSGNPYSDMTSELD